MHINISTLQKHLIYNKLFDWEQSRLVEHDLERGNERLTMIFKELTEIEFSKVISHNQKNRNMSMSAH